ncbi:MAG TPA: 1,4-alpha-glucan branching protein GlgB [Myxococcales bacterium]
MISLLADDPMISLLSDDDLHLFNEGSHLRLYEHLGSHLKPGGTQFAVWAPNAKTVNVVGDWNGWNKHQDALAPRGKSGIWEGFVKGIGKGTKYKFHIEGQGGYRVDKADPLAIHAETPPRTASVVWDLDYKWGDSKWMEERGPRSALDAPISIYEMHIGSWRRRPEEGNRPLNYRELAEPLCEYLKRLGFTHVEFLPVMEHPFYGSWGYQTTGYFAPTSRYGTPQDFMYLIDRLHQAGIGVILDWVPSHFPSDEMGLANFDGTALYEHADPRQGFHPDWKSFIFNYGRHEVRSFLLSSGMFWLDRYHADGLRVDAVASMLYLDYSRKAGEWIPNVHGGRENLEAISFLQRLNTEVFGRQPGAQTYAEESTSWPGVSRPIWLGGLGFGFKWDMGWMHDTLAYMQLDPVHRRFHHNALTFRGLYAFHENFVLPLSHDEVVHGKGSLLNKMAGDDWQKRANLRLLYANQWSLPGKKLLFMGSEFGQLREWAHESSLDWHLTSDPAHAGIQQFVSDLNGVMRREGALHQLDVKAEGFEWVDANDSNQSVASYLRKGKSGAPVLVVLNYTPIAREGYRVGVPQGGEWRELLNSDAPVYGGSGVGNYGTVRAEESPSHGREFSLLLTLPPLGALFLKPAE